MLGKPYSSVAVRLLAGALLALLATPALAKGPNLNDASWIRSLAPDLSPRVVTRAMNALACSADRSIRDARILAIIDYSLPSTEKRLWVFDRSERRLLFHELVAHGKNTGANYATRFSNVDGSKQSSLGLFRAAETYVGGNGYSLRLDGLDPEINDLARQRLIVIHGAWYVSEDHARKWGRLGRSWGCPALKSELARPIIDTLKHGAAVFVSAEDPSWLAFEAGRCGGGELVAGGISTAGR